jgi:hypothetical protein
MNNKNLDLSIDQHYNSFFCYNKEQICKMIRCYNEISAMAIFIESFSIDFLRAFQVFNSTKFNIINQASRSTLNRSGTAEQYERNI